MQKLDGDLTSIYFNLFPNKILDEMIRNSIINQEQKNNILLLLKYKIDQSNDYLQSNKISNITIDLFDHFMNELFKLWKIYHPIITKEMIKLRLLLIKIGYDYNDNKYDNYGYILNDTPDDELTPKIFDKYLHVYFLDWNSGLINLNDQKIKDDIPYIISNINDGMDYGVNGSVNLSRFCNVIDLTLIPHDTNEDVNKILQKDYKFDLESFIPTKISNITEVEEFIFSNTTLNIQNIIDNGYPPDITSKKEELNKTINEIERVYKIKKLESRPDFIASGQNIRNFQTYKLADNEIDRLDKINELFSSPGFTASGQDIRNFQTYDSARDELRRLMMLKNLFTVLLEKFPYINACEFVKRFTTFHELRLERDRLMLFDMLQHSQKFAATGLDINQMNIQNLTQYEIDDMNAEYSDN